MATVPVSAAKMAAVHTAGGGGTPPVRGMAVRGTWRGTIKLSADDAATSCCLPTAKKTMP